MKNVVKSRSPVVDALASAIGTPINDAHYTAFGKITLRWTMLETLMMEAVWVILANNIDRGFAQLIEAQLGGRQRRDILSTVASMLKAGPLKTQLGNVLSEVKQHARIREHVAHHLWKAGKKPGKIKPFYLKAKGALDAMGHLPSETEYSAEMLEKHAKRMEVTYKSLESLIKAVNKPKSDSNKS